MLAKFGLPFEKATPLVHFPKALKRPRNNAGPASIYIKQAHTSVKFEAFEAFRSILIGKVHGESYTQAKIQQHSPRIQQHIPTRIGRNHSSSDSAITKHLKESRGCVPLNPASRFHVLARALHRCHLDVLEAIYIQKLCPSLCQQASTQKLFLH